MTRAPSGTERILTILRGQLHLVLGRDKLPAAKRHLQLLEVYSRPSSKSLLRLYFSTLYSGLSQGCFGVGHFQYPLILLDIFLSYFILLQSLQPVVYCDLIPMQGMRKEFAQAKVLALAQREVLFEVHELNMATTRLRLRFPGEKIPNISVLHPEQVPQQNVHLTAEKFAALEELKRLKGQLRYLNVSFMVEYSNILLLLMFFPDCMLCVYTYLSK